MNTPLYSGVITNYACNAACRHCMYASAPACPKDYITPERTEEIAAVLREAGTTSVHIGGGEPFLNFPALCRTVEILLRHGIDMDYIETNAFWAKEEERTRERLRTLRSIGVNTIMVSVDPFHLEYIPLSRPLLLLRLLREERFDFFVWQDRYLRRFRTLPDPARTYTAAELEQLLGADYLADTAREYGLGINGRALSIAPALYPNRPAEAWIDGNPCRELLSVHHCHVDLYGNAVPPGCTGLGAAVSDFLEEDIPADRYPVFRRLLEGGTASLYGYAVSRGFVPDPAGYPTRCAFCYAMRAYLVENNILSADLTPVYFYEQVSKSLR